MLIRFEFIGGPKDGESLVEHLDDDEFGTATAYYYATRGGEPGTWLWCRTEYAIELMQLLSDSALRDLREQGSPQRGHLYEVICRSRGNGDICIRARHVAPFPGRAAIPLAIEAGVKRGDLPRDASAIGKNAKRASGEQDQDARAEER